MKIAAIKIMGFRSFGPDEISIDIKLKLSAFIGLNSSGKSATLEALRKVFGSTASEREITKKDFHFGKDEEPESITSRKLSIEIQFTFSDTKDESVPHFFNYMVVEKEGADPYLRVRLESSWAHDDIEPDGVIDSKLYFIKVADGESENEENKLLFPGHLKSLLQIIYVPAIRRPAEQLRYSSGTILYRVLRKIKWTDDFKKDFEEKIQEINKNFQDLSELKTVQTAISSFWNQFHKDERYKDTELGFGESDMDSILKKIEISFTPTPDNRKFLVDDLGEGYRSLFYLTLVCALLEIEEKAIGDTATIGINQPLLTILAIEEPENHIAPQLLGRVVSIMAKIAEKNNSQVFLSSHTPAIIKRIEPEAIFHFRITENYQTQINNILLPEKKDEAYKYTKEALHNYPEIYFARLVVIGEGDSEEVIINRLSFLMGINFDDNIITFAPLGHRFVNHIWKLLKVLGIPYITLLDLDTERNGGGYGRIKYVIEQLIAIGADKDVLLKLADKTVLGDKDFEKMHTWTVENTDDMKNLARWVNRLKRYNIYYSSPLDIDFLMLTHYPEFYKKAIPKGGGPQIPDKTKKPDEFKKKVEAGVHATLKDEDAEGLTYSEADKELMIWYNYHFLGRGKPGTHIEVLAGLEKKDIEANLPIVFKEIFEKIPKLLTSK